MKDKACCQCEAHSDVVNRYGYYFCVECESKLALHSVKTILKNSKSRNLPEPFTYEDEVADRLQTMEKDFIKRKSNCSTYWND
ncbi:MAG: hypothetical protein VCD00_01770 [Candidatus Hydrogenedentota bacterium]